METKKLSEQAQKIVNPLFEKILAIDSAIEMLAQRRKAAHKDVWKLIHQEVPATAEKGVESQYNKDTGEVTLY